jgi:ABC-type glycerol-3-phosphate transport system substrate-binding protein
MRKFCLCLWLLACLGSASYPASAITLRFWAVGSSVQDVAMYRDLAADFARRTGIRVEVTPLAWGNFATKYFTAMAGGLPPDIGVTNLGGPFDYGSVGGVVDLRTEFKGDIEPLE